LQRLIQILFTLSGSRQSTEFPQVGFIVGMPYNYCKDRVMTGKNILKNIIGGTV